MRGCTHRETQSSEPRPPVLPVGPRPPHTRLKHHLPRGVSHWASGGLSDLCFLIFTMGGQHPPLRTRTAEPSTQPLLQTYGRCC